MMFNPICRVFVRRYLSVTRVISPNPYNYYLCFLQLPHFSSAAKPKPISEIANQALFTVNYLTSKFEFSSETAVRVSRYRKFVSPKNPDLVISLLKNHGFTTEQLGRLVRTFPRILETNPQKTILPKIEFFRSSGMSETQLTNIFLSAPYIFKSSLNKQIIPCFSYVKNLFDSNGTKIGFVKHFSLILCCNLQSQLMPNIEILRKAGVPDSRIVFLLQYQPRSIMVKTESFRKVVDEVKKLGFNPLKSRFIAAVCVFRSMGKSAWEHKVAVYKKWGWSEDEILSAFRIQPSCMALSKDGIMKKMDFLVNEMGIDSSILAKRADVMTYSLEKRMKPRYSVYKILSEKGLMKKGHFCLIFKYTESKFLEKFVHCYEKEVPELLKLYQKELATAGKN